MWVIRAKQNLITLLTSCFTGLDAGVLFCYNYQHIYLFG